MPHKSVEDRRAKDKAYYAAHAAEIKARERRRYRARRRIIRARRAKLSTKHKAKNAERERARYAALRVAILTAYGGKCACCNEATQAFLELDHINGDGAQHRRLLGRGSKAIYGAVRAKGFPRESFQVLCANCNQGKKRCGGVCPHRTSNSFQRANGKGDS